MDARKRFVGHAVVASGWVTSDALLVRARADWRDEDDETEGLTLSHDQVQVEVDEDGVTLGDPGISGFEVVRKRSRTRTPKLHSSSES